MDTLAKRLKWARKKAGLTQGQLAETSGVNQSAISKMEIGTIQRPTGLLGLARSLNVDPDWLDTGSGHPDREASNVSDVPSSEVPLLTWVQAGRFSPIIEDAGRFDTPMKLLCPMRHGEGTFALEVRGLSMHDPGGSPSFREGDRIFVDPSREAIHRSLVIARLDDVSEATFKQLIVEGDKRFLLALNPAWPERIIPINGNCSIVGVVIGKLETFV